MTVDRRGFLRASATAGGGLLLAFTFGCKSENKAGNAAPQPTATTEPIDLNAWIRIDPDDTITFKIADSEMGQGIMTALSMILAEELDADWTKVRAEHAPVDAAKYGRQSTGGSTSVRQGWDGLKQAGAAAREMIVSAAATRLGVPPDQLTTEASAVIHTASNRRVRYGEIAKDAAAITPPKSPTPKSPERYFLVGKPTKRLDQRAKVMGEAVYGLDVRLPGMKFAMLARPPTIGGSVKAFDATAAKAIPGVEQIVQVPQGVAVIASNTWAARRGVDALTVTWDDGPNTSLSSASVSATLKKLVASGKQVRSDGKPTEALERAKKKLASTYEVPYLAHAPMEPLNCTVHVEKDRCRIWTGTQSPTAAHKIAMDVLGLAADRVSVVTTFLGGGFGRRSQTDYVAEAVHVAKQVQGPVQLVWTREDDIRGGQYRPAALSQLEGALDPEGWPAVWIQRMASPSILASMGRVGADGIDGTSVEGVANLPYAIPDVHVTYAQTDLPVTTWFWRSVGSSQNAWAVECFLDELARAGGKDPVEVRRRLLAKHPRHLGVLEAAVAKAGWGTELPAGRARGVAVHESFGSYVAEVAEVSIENGTPRIHRVVCAIDCGRVINPDTIAAQIESGIYYGLSAALHGAIALDGGKVKTSNFHDYPVVRMANAPVIETVIVPSTEAPGGVGEPSTPPIAPAVCNALLVLTGKPVRTLPIRLA